ncbi:hypothetical protein J1N35_025526 [Gossypium stocksii]|uniref:Uncharacterized protein n=1 Tax=Gossypium stocksii TaxID=47602 RepID=A0A9D3V953_9ROSI|nr:hypothetical protein J1N35_025526 [Gossypium stocksii]
MVKDPIKTACNQIELPMGPITRARANRFKEAISGLIDQVWGEVVARFIDRAWACTPCCSHWLLLGSFLQSCLYVTIKDLNTSFQEPFRA